MENIRLQVFKPSEEQKEKIKDFLPSNLKNVSFGCITTRNFVYISGQASISCEKERDYICHDLINQLYKHLDEDTLKIRALAWEPILSNGTFAHAHRIRTYSA